MERLVLSSEEPNFQTDENLFKLLAKLLLKCRAWVASHSDAAPQIQDGDVASCQRAVLGSASYNSPIPNLDQMVSLQTMDLENDQWLEAVLGLSTSYP